MEPERKFIVEESLPEIKGIIYVRILIKKSSIVLDNSLLDISPIIFSYIDNKTKFRTVKYNKRFQNKININIMDYRRLSGKYILFEKKGRGKEYNAYNDELLFDGEYLNGMRNGYGREYRIKNEYLNDINKGMYIFENQYLKSQIENKNEEVKTNILVFEGEYLNGKRNENGKGKEYDYIGNIIFEGEYRNGKKWNGIIREYESNGYYLKANIKMEKKMEKENNMKYIKTAIFLDN